MKFLLIIPLFLFSCTRKKFIEYEGTKCEHVSKENCGISLYRCQDNKVRLCLVNKTLSVDKDGNETLK